MGTNTDEASIVAFGNRLRNDKTLPSAMYILRTSAVETIFKFLSNDECHLGWIRRTILCP